MKNIHILPTDKPSRLIKNNLGLIRVSDNFTQSDLDFIQAEFVNIYITSDEEDINENDYIITLNKKVIQVSYLLSEDVANGKKIILTTDQDLIKDGVQAIDDEFLEWFVKNPSCEKVIIDKWINSYKDLYEITIPKTTQQIIDEDFYGGLDMGQIISKEERSYSEEDMKLSFEAGRKRGNSGYPNTDNFRQPNFEEFIKQFKNE